MRARTHPTPGQPPCTATASTSGGRWYERGLRFGCRECGRCCSGAPGYVWVTREEIARIASHLGASSEEMAAHVRWVEGRWSLRELGGGDCVFLRFGGACAIYPVRPVQCRTWPFWSGNVASPDAWQVVMARCPGAGRGKWYSADRIDRLGGRSS